MTYRSPLMTPGNTSSGVHRSGTVSTPLFRSFLIFACLKGANRAELLTAARLNEHDLEDDEVRLPIDSYCALIKSGKALTGLPELPLLFASHADFSEVSIAGLIANASKTMLDALMQLNRYGRLAIDIPFKGDGPLRYEQMGQTDWVIDQRIVPEDAPELIETSLTYLITGPRRFLPRSHVVEVQVTYPAPSHRTAYEEIWACPIQFEAPHNAIAVAPWVAAHKIRQHPEYAFGILTAHADQMLDTLKEKKTFASDVEALILPVLHTGDVSIEWTAERLKMSRQTLYRHLKAEGTTFEAVLDALRQRLAREYLEAGKITVAETAYLLGFADSSPFTRAFKRWTGLSPGAYQKQKS